MSPLDRRPRQPTKAAMAAAVAARTPERISAYFDFTGPDGEEKAERKVKRYELLAILDQIERGKAQMKWWRRLLRWLFAPRGSGPVRATEPTAGEIERGEARPVDGG